MTPMTRKYRDGWKAAVKLADGKVRIVSRTVYPSKASALLHAKLWLSAWQE
jgi:hypothetical protein